MTYTSWLHNTANQHRGKADFDFMPLQNWPDAFMSTYLTAHVTTEQISSWNVCGGNTEVAKERTRIWFTHVCYITIRPAEALYYLFSNWELEVNRESCLQPGPTTHNQGGLQLHLLSKSWKTPLLLYSKWGKNRRRMDERAGKPDNITFIHCLCAVIREGEKKRNEERREVDSWAELKTNLPNSVFLIWFSSKYTVDFIRLCRVGK